MKNENEIFVRNEDNKCMIWYINFFDYKKYINIIIFLISKKKYLKNNDIIIIFITYKNNNLIKWIYICMSVYVMKIYLNSI